ncbi:MAG: acetolactate synthase small subunit [Desulfatiglandales bacterium]
MPTHKHETQDPSRHALLELIVNNHPGVMSQICGLFSRRAFNLEGILCTPIGQGEQSRIRLLVSEDQRLDQMIKQILKLEDVIDLRRCGADHQVFARLDQVFQEPWDQDAQASREAA